MVCFESVGSVIQVHQAGLAGEPEADHCVYAKIEIFFSLQMRRSTADFKVDCMQCEQALPVGYH